MIRLEIGPGPEKLGYDWTTVSAVPGPAVDHLADWGTHRLPFDDGEVDEVYACHVIEHLPYLSVVPALVDAWRILRPGGLIELHTVDVRKALDENGWEGANYRIMSQSRDGSLSCRQFHRSLFTPEWLRALLDEAGFVDVVEAGDPRGPEKHGPCSFGLRARR